MGKVKSGKFRFHLKAANDEIIAASQGDPTKTSAERGIESAKTSAPAAKVGPATSSQRVARQCQNPTARGQLACNATACHSGEIVRN
jgi:uncharacterized protein YegP (UPF0339 family)